MPRDQAAAIVQALRDEQRAAMRVLTRHQQQNAEAFRAAQKLLNAEPDEPIHHATPPQSSLVA